MKKVLKFIVLLWVLLFSIDTVCAQNIQVDATTKVVDGLKSDEEINYAEISKQINIMEERIKDGEFNTELLSLNVKTLSEYRANLISARKVYEKDLQFVQKRVDALGEAPTEDGVEIESIATKRKEFNDELSMLKAVIVETDVLLAKIDELDVLILNARNQQLLGNLLQQHKPILLPQNLFHSSSLFVTFVLDIAKSPINWYKGLDTEQKYSIRLKFFTGTLIFMLLLWFAIHIRLFIMKHFGYKNDTKLPRLDKKVLAAFLVALAYGIIPASLIAGFMLWLYSTNIVGDTFFGIVLNTFLLYSLLVFLLKALARVVFTPYNPRWRLVNIDDDRAKKITNKLYMAIITIAICSFLEHVAIKANYSIELMSFISIIASAVKGLFIVIITKAIFLDNVSQSTDEDDEDENSETESSETIGKAIKISFFTILGVAIVFSISLFGYSRLSAFIFNRLIFSVLITASLVLLRKLFSEFLHQMLFSKFWFKTFRLRRKVRMSIDFWTNMILDPIFVIVGFFLILTIWGASTDLLLQSLKKLLTGFKVGGINISLISIALGIVSFFLSLAIFKALRTKFYNQVLDKMNIDDGIRHSLSSGLGFISVVLAVIIAIVMMGGNLTNIAIIASALSVGIGFGLQDIINNFVSGIIILFERPFKVGDWVLVNGEEGKIKQINIRSTEIETFKKASIIIPNATLISNSVTNLTHENNWARHAIKVGVAYGSNVELVKEILLECAKSHELVLKNPPPYVLFQNFGENSLEFELRCYTNDIWNGWIIPSDLRFAINKRFIEEGVEIPFQQIVVHSGEKVAREDQFYAKKDIKIKTKN